MFESPQQLATKFEKTGYFIDPVMAKVVFVAIRLELPIILEGPAGSGKSKLATSIAEAAGTSIERLQCYKGITDRQAIGQYDESLQRLYLEFSKEQGQPWQEIVKALRSREFYRAGPLMRALESESRCVLLIDELDKVPEDVEALLLEPLSDWQLSIPELGTIPAKSKPVVVITSNEERHLGDPIRRRSVYIRVDHPTPQREAEIIANRLPHADPMFHRGIAGLARAFRNYSLEKPPSVSEMLHTAIALQALGKNAIEPEDKDWILSLLAKTEKDRRHLLIREGYNSLIADGARYAAEIANLTEASI